MLAEVDEDEDDEDEDDEDEEDAVDEEDDPGVAAEVTPGEVEAEAAALARELIEETDMSLSFLGP